MLNRQVTEKGERLVVGKLLLIRGDPRPEGQKKLLKIFHHKEHLLSKECCQ